MSYLSSKQNFTANALKIVAILAMTLDHIAVGFIRQDTITYSLFRAIGRLTIVIMCYMVVEGYNHTHNIKKYLLRLFIFALISHVPFVFFSTGKISLFFTRNVFHTSVIWSLFLGLVALCIWNNDKLDMLLKIVSLILICILSVPGDWSYFAVLLIWSFGISYGNKKMQMFVIAIFAMFIGFLSFLILSATKVYPWYKEIYHFGLLFSIPLLFKYNGKLGTLKHMKWVFYAYYPLHMIVLGIVAYSM